MRHAMLFHLLWPILTAAMATAAPFAPTPLRISAPGIVEEWSDYEFRIPVTISGGPATVTLSLFTWAQAAAIRDIRAGNLGWHYVNLIDTCVYVSPPYRLPSGPSVIEWNGRVENDCYQLPLGSYTYYLCGFADSIPAAKAFSFLGSVRFDRSAVVTGDGVGNPLSNPVFFSAARSSDPTGETWNTRSRWTLGGDPEDASLLETTRYRSFPDRGRMAVDLNDTRWFFTQALETGKMVTRAWDWTPNGDAVARSFWGEAGLSSVRSALEPETSPFSGPVTDGTYLYSANLASEQSGDHPTLDCMDMADGTLITWFDLGAWFGDDAAPVDLARGPERLFLSSPRSAQFLAVNPLAGLEDADCFAAWENSIGDGFADTAPAPGETRGAAMDWNGFALFAENGLPPSIGVFTPDGSGAGFFPLSGVTGVQLDGVRVVDTGSAFDGLYFGTADDRGTVRYAGYDVFKGTIQFGGELWFPYIRLLGPYRNQELRAGSEYRVIWEGYGDVSLEFSEDGGVTWRLIADGLSGWYVWRVPDIRSSDCRLRVLTNGIMGLTSTSYPFTISGPVAISDDTPRAFGLRPNTPNPFNPSTTLSFTLSAPGNVSLTVYDATGRKVTDLAHGFRAAGNHSVIWNAKACASGVYFAVLKAGEQSETRKMLLVR